MGTIEQMDKQIAQANKDDGKREKYIDSLKQNPEFQEYIVEPIKKGMEEIKSVSSIDITQEPQKVLAQIEAQKISYEYITLLLSFFLDNDNK